MLLNHLSLIFIWDESKKNFEFGMFELEIHTVSSQNFRSFCFLPFFLLFYLSKIVQLNVFREIATYTSRLLSFDKLFKFFFKL